MTGFGAPFEGWRFAAHSIAAFLDERYEDTIRVSSEVLRAFPGFPPAMRQMAAALAMSVRLDEAHDVVQEILKQLPHLTVTQVGKMIPIKNGAGKTRWLNALKMAGLPE